MHLALAVELHFGHLGVLNEGKRSVFFAELAERARQAHFVLSVLDVDGESLGWRGRAGDLRSGRRDLPVGETIAGDEAFETGEGDGVALLRTRHLRGGRAHEPGQAADALLDAARIDDCGAVD